MVKKLSGSMIDLSTWDSAAKLTTISGFSLINISRCSNKYGPYQFPEKLITLMINNATQDKPLPVYGEGLNVRDWLYVKDHCYGILAVLEKGKVGEVYNLGGHNEKANI